MFVEIGADVSAGVRGILQVNGNLVQLQRETRRSADAWTGLTGRLARTGFAIQGVRDLYRGVRDLAGGVGSLALAAANDRAEMDRLEAAVTNTGQAIDDGLRKQLDDTIESMRETTMFSESDLRQALTNLVVGTGDVDEALRRLPIAMDVAAAKQQDLASTADAFSKSGDGLQRALHAIGIGYEDAAGDAGDLAAAQLLAARAGITVSGAMKAVGNESVRKRWGIPDPKDIRAVVSDQQMLDKARKRTAGASKREVDDVALGWKNVHDELDEVREGIGALFLPLAKGGVRFLSDSLKGVRRLIMLFSTDVSGPRISGVRKLWKEIFGTEMPGALQAVVGGFTDIKTRIDQFVKDINSTDEQTVRAAIKNLFEGLKTDITKALGELGSELDKLGPVGFGLKLLATSIVINKATGGLFASPMDVLGIVRDTLSIGWLTVQLLGKGPTMTIAAGILVGVGLMDLKNKIDVAKSITDWTNLIGSVVTAAGLTVLGISLGLAAAPAVVIGVSAALLISILGITFDDLSGKNINDEIAKEYGKPKLPPITAPAGGGPDARDRNRGVYGRGTASPPATLEDIYAAYERVTGGQISADYARQIRDQGFSYAQVASKNIFAGDVTPDYAGNVRDFAMGGSGIVTQPTLFRAGERGAERYDFRPVGSSGSGAGLDIGAGSARPINVSVNVGGSVIGIADLEERVRKAVRDGVLSGGFRGVLA